MRKAEVKRKTTETDITLEINIDGTGLAEIDSGSGFFDHMLGAVCRHGGFDMWLCCRGDTHVDYHHTVEDIALVLGKAVSEALGERKGITRYGCATIPMDEALVSAAVDISGRGGFYGSAGIERQKIGDFDSELADEFFVGFCRGANLTLHLKRLGGRNAHHIAEAAFKAFARALRQAVAADERSAGVVPSTKGTL